MNSKALCMYLIAVFLVIQGNSFGQHEPVWKGKIEYEDGVKVVKNPGEPLYKPIHLETEEDLCFGNEDDDEYMLYLPVWLSVDSKGNIFVLVVREFQIRKFDSDGKFLAAVGKRGQGPGEFEQPRGLYLDSLGRVYTFDSRRNNLHIFSNELSFIETRKLEFRPYGFSLSQDDRMILSNIHYSPPSSSTDIILTNPSGELIDQIASFPYELPPMIKNMMLGNFERQEKRPESEKFTKSEVKKAYVFPEHKPFYTNILVDDKSQIFAKKLKLYDPKDESVCFDFFNEEGVYLHEVTMPFSPRALVGQCLYRFVSNRETGYVVIKRYRITNWDQIKTGIN